MPRVSAPRSACRLLLTACAASAFLILFALSAPPPVAGQNAAISVDNRAQLAEIARVLIPDATQIAWSPDGSRLAAATPDGAQVIELDALIAGEASLQPFGPANTPVQALVYHPEGMWIALAAGDSVIVWNTTTSTDIARVPGVAPVAFSGDGRFLAATSADGLSIQEYETAGYTPGALHEGHRERVLALSSAPLSSTLASISLDNTLRVWDSATGDQLRFQRSRGREFVSLDFSPTGALIVSGVERGTVRLLNLAVTTERAFTVRAERAEVTSVAFNPAGDLVAFTVNNTLQLWAMDLNAIPTVYPFDAPVRAARFSPDGTRLAVLAGDGTLSLWGVGDE